MSEQVIRHRGAKRDENGRLVEASDTPLQAFQVAPRGGSLSAERGRNSENVACTVYFTTWPDIVNGDELTVRGERYPIIVNDWRLAGRGGLEVLCTRGQG